MKPQVQPHRFGMQTLLTIALSSLILSCQGLPTAIADNASSQPNFASLCRNRADLAPDTRRTVELILKGIKIVECDRAAAHLSSVTTLDLSYEDTSPYNPEEKLEDWLRNRITDLTPLAGLTQLRSLDLTNTNNAVEDLRPLAKLTNLTDLYLGWNRISDLKPLLGLPQIGKLVLSSNDFTDFSPLAELPNLSALNIGLQPNDNDTKPDFYKPLAKMTKLKVLRLMGSAFQDLRLLEGMKDLTDLDLFESSVTDLRPLAKLTRLEYLNLEDTEITDIRPLAGLENLTALSIATKYGIKSLPAMDISPLCGLPKLTSFYSGSRPVTRSADCKILQK